MPVVAIIGHRTEGKFLKLLLKIKRYMQNTALTELCCDNIHCDRLFIFL